MTPKKQLCLMLVALAILFFCGSWVVFAYWKELRVVPGGMESGIAMVRNLGLIIIGIIALALGGWRSWVASQQAEIAQRGLLNERYQRGAEMLGSSVLAVRLGGIYALGRLDMDHPEQYHAQITRLLCAFVRHPTIDESDMAKEQKSNARKFPFIIRRMRKREDIQAAMKVISTRDKSRVALEKKEIFTPYLANADLRYVSLKGANLSGCLLQMANLSKAVLTGANLSNVMLTKTDLSGTDFSAGQTASGPATGLTQSELDKACAKTDEPPILDGVIDAETGEFLVWQGQVATDE